MAIQKAFLTLLFLPSIYMAPPSKANAQLEWLDENATLDDFQLAQLEPYIQLLGKRTGNINGTYIKVQNLTSALGTEGGGPQKKKKMITFWIGHHPRSVGILVGANFMLCEIW